MRKMFLTSAATAALLFGAPAMAGAPEPGAPMAQQQMAAGERAGVTAAQQARADADPFRSYRFFQDELGGTMPDGFAADDLMHQRVADAQGAKLGVITDLLIGPDERIDQVIVETPVAPYESFALEIEQLEREPAVYAEYSVPMTREQLAELPRYHRGDTGTWTPAPELRPQQ